VGAKGTQRRRSNAAARITRSNELLFSTEENIPLSFESNIILILQFKEAILLDTQT
jgi:hypothetical protein